MAPEKVTVGQDEVTFECPACGKTHTASLADHEFDGNIDKPTVRPAVLTEDDGEVCHALISEGQVHFLPESTHALVGQTVDLEVKKKSENPPPKNEQADPEPVNLCAGPSPLQRLTELEARVGNYSTYIDCLHDGINDLTARVVALEQRTAAPADAPQDLPQDSPAELPETTVEEVATEPESQQ